MQYQCCDFHRIQCTDANASNTIQIIVPMNVECKQEMYGLKSWVIPTKHLLKIQINMYILKVMHRHDEQWENVILDIGNIL